ncbi:MAG: cbb3-type cytochrome c oxidase subunit 3 [Pseudomonadota bacterium]
MDLNLFRSLVLVILTVSFVGLWIAVWSKSRKTLYEEAALTPLEEDQPQEMD